MKVLGIVGWSGSGKTTLIAALIPLFRARGVSVSTVKHAHHRLELDQPGKDSFRHRAAGAQEVILANDSQFALFRTHGGALGMPALLARLAPVDLVLVEGFKDDPFPKLEVYRAALGRPPLWPEMVMVAVAADGDPADCPHPILPLDRPEAIADFVMARFALQPRLAGEG